MAELMKHKLGQAEIDRIANNIGDVWPQFDQHGFCQNGMNGLERLELKARVMHIIEVLHHYLPADFAHTADIFIKLAANWNDDKRQETVSIFAIWPIIDYVGEHGLEHVDKSLDALEVLTPLFSAEFAIRPFINAHFDKTYERLLAWCGHENTDVRRLASEGIRPRLPWGLQLKQFIIDPTYVMNLLEHLKYDKDEYVYRSVANNLNDISKDHAELVIKTCQKWLENAPPKVAKSTLWVAKRATRSLVKQGHPMVFGLLGFSEKLDVGLNKLALKNTSIKMGQALEFEFVLISNKQQKFVLDFAIHFMKANGKQAAKMFKLKNMDMTSGEEITVNKRQMFKTISTRKYYAGQHRLEIFLNGVSYGEIAFILNI